MLKEEGTGYFDTWISRGRTGSKSKHNLPEILPVGDVTVGRRHLRKRKRAVDHDPDLARLDPCENLVQLRDRARLFHEKSGDRKAGGFPPLRKRRRQVARASAEAAQRDEAPARGQDADPQSGDRDLQAARHANGGGGAARFVRGAAVPRASARHSGRSCSSGSRPSRCLASAASCIGPAFLPPSIRPTPWDSCWRTRASESRCSGPRSWRSPALKRCTLIWDISAATRSAP